MFLEDATETLGVAHPPLLEAQLAPFTGDIKGCAFYVARLRLFARGRMIKTCFLRGKEKKRITSP